MAILSLGGVAEGIYQWYLYLSPQSTHVWPSSCYYKKPTSWCSWWLLQLFLISNSYVCFFSLKTTSNSRLMSSGSMEVCTGCALLQFIVFLLQGQVLRLSFLLCRRPFFLTIVKVCFLMYSVLLQCLFPLLLLVNSASQTIGFLDIR